MTDDKFYKNGSEIGLVIKMDCLRTLVVRLAIKYIHY